MMATRAPAGSQALGLNWSSTRAASCERDSRVPAIGLAAPGGVVAVGLIASTQPAESYWSPAPSGSPLACYECLRAGPSAVGFRAYGSGAAPTLAKCVASRA